MPKHHSKIVGPFLSVLGYLLSPFSWWNDIFLNIPLAYGFGTLCGLFWDRLFLPATVLGYWFTNWIGLVLMHRGFTLYFKKSSSRSSSSKKEIIYHLLISVFYTILLVLCIHFKVLRLPQNYFTSKKPL